MPETEAAAVAPDERSPKAILVDMGYRLAPSRHYGHRRIVDAETGTVVADLTATEASAWLAEAGFA